MSAGNDEGTKTSAFERIFGKLAHQTEEPDPDTCGERRNTTSTSSGTSSIWDQAVGSYEPRPTIMQAMNAALAVLAERARIGARLETDTDEEIDEAIPARPDLAEILVLAGHLALTGKADIADRETVALIERGAGLLYRSAEVIEGRRPAPRTLALAETADRLALRILDLFVQISTHDGEWGPNAGAAPYLIREVAALINDVEEEWRRSAAVEARIVLPRVPRIGANAAISGVLAAAEEIGPGHQRYPTTEVPLLRVLAAVNAMRALIPLIS